MYYIVGFISLCIRKIQEERKYAFLYEFRSNYVEFANGLIKGNFDNEKYVWLKKDSVKMQSEMGHYGRIALYQPPYSNVGYRNYEIILNGISYLRDLAKDRDFKRELCSQAKMIEDMLLLYDGVQEGNVNTAIKNIRNPLIWLREGIQFIITLPVSIIYWFGLMQYNNYNKLTGNFFIKVISFIVGLIGFISSVTTICTGYSPMLEIFKK